MNCITTWTGKQFDLCNPDPSQVDVMDIAHSLAKQPYENGHLDRFYSVAQHCVHVSEVAPRPWMLPALLHIASATYTGFINRKLRPILGRTFADFESRIQVAVATRFDVRWPMEHAIRESDERMFATANAAIGYEREGIELEGPPGHPPEPYPMQIEPWSPELAFDRFIGRYEFLTRSP